MSNAGLAAAVQVVRDLAQQGWIIRVDRRGDVTVAPPSADTDPVGEKARVRRQELWKRDEQLSTPSVRRFVAEMEKPREFNGAFVSIFSLMRDGEDLANTLRRAETSGLDSFSALQHIIDPYVQVIGENERCDHTGLRLGDIWRYFRHTWANQYTSTPGRTMLLLVRDRAAPRHPVIGIAALGSAIVQISERDEWIGWHPSRFLHELTENPTADMAEWVVTRLEQNRDELYLDDLVEDGLYWPALWHCPTKDAVERLSKEAQERRRDHHRFVRKADFKQNLDKYSWRERAESDLFRSKRCLALADLLRARAELTPFLEPEPSKDGLAAALRDPTARRAIASVLRRAKAESVGTEIADLTVCGAVAPYNAILGGKLVSMLSVSPCVIRAYYERYHTYASQIASSMAGRAIHRRSHLVFIGTTSLYGSGASQYNRLSIPASVLGGATGIEFRRLGRSRSFGTSHLSKTTVDALTQFVEQRSPVARVNSIFGEGVNPKLRKVRQGIELLGWSAEQLLQHRRPRIIYGVSLVDNLLSYLLGIDDEPQYPYPTNDNGTERIADWWMTRWLSKRIRSDEVLNVVGTHSLTQPVSHGARVQLPAIGAD